MQEHNMNSKYKMDRKIKLAAFAFCICASGIYTDGLSAQTLTQAKKWFTDGEFAKAKPVFEKLVKQAPSNANYNFWYGACCYETGETEKGLPYLEKSAQRKVINGYLYLGKAYYDQYRFDDAISNLEEHIYWLEKKNRDTSEAEELMSKFRKGARMIRGVENVVVVDSFVVDKAGFLSAYKLSSQAGTIRETDASASEKESVTVAPAPEDSVMTAGSPEIPAYRSADISHNKYDILTEYINEMDDKKILAVAVNDSLYELNASVKLIDRWSTPQKMKGLDETCQQLNYPFLDSDGTTLYFSAKGEESLGGYDIFVTRADSDENTYFKPDNLGYPFNSQYNDYMYAIDDYSNLGWFASDRYQPEGKVCIYVFVPNDSKTVYNYESEDPSKMISLARLDNISLTQTDREKLIKAKQRLATLMYSNQTKAAKADFHFVVNDGKVYTSIDDFRNPEAKKLFREYLDMVKDLKALESDLKEQRKTYARANASRQSELTLAILDKEKRVEELRREIDTIVVKVRNTELK